MTWRRMRIRTATLMILVALIALGLGGYRAYQAAIIQEKIDRAVTIFRTGRPTTDMGRTDVRLGAISADGAHQTVIFTDIYRGGPILVTIPLTGRGNTSSTTLNSTIRTRQRAGTAIPYYLRPPLP